jgi:CRISPR-associated endonuclease Cas1
MFTNKDVEYRTIYVVNCIKDRNLRVCNGELLLEEAEEKKTLTKLPFQKILALFVVGHIHVSTPLLEKCKKFNVALVVVKPSLRPVFFWADSAEANYLLRQKQYALPKSDISIAKWIMQQKVKNQLMALTNTRKKDALTNEAVEVCQKALTVWLSKISDHNKLMGMEGYVSKFYFSAYFNELGWKQRLPRTKCDVLNVALDIGYTMLFNYVECFIRMFGFDVYVGVYHRLWFKRKSLVCDLIEPFRCVIDKTVRNAFKRRQFKQSDFQFYKGEYRLKLEKNAVYTKVFFDALIPYKTAVFCFVRSYYRCFMQSKEISLYPNFDI